MSDEIEIKPDYKKAVDGVFDLIVICPFCHQKHIHGGGDGMFPSLGYRSAHCGLGTYRLTESGIPNHARTDDKNSGYIYFVQMGPYTKIGRARNVEKRLKQFTSILMPYPMRIIIKRWVHDAVWAEQWLHQVFKDYRMEGEWFQLPDESLFWVARLPDISPQIATEQETILNEWLSEEDKDGQNTIN